MAFSDGHVNYVVAFDLDVQRTKQPMILRAMSWDPLVKAADENLTKYRGEPSTIGGHAVEGEYLLLVMDRIEPSTMHMLAEHELGHMAGLEWPKCSGPRQVCRHALDDVSIMSPVVVGPFGPGDLAMCQASCLCP